MKTLGKWMAIAVIAFAIVVGGQAVATSFAQTPDQPTTQTQPTTADKKPFKANKNKKGDKALKGLTASLIHQTATLTNLEHTDVVQQLKDGKSLTDIATANGSSEQAVIDAAIAKIDEKLSKAVENGKITAEQKTTLLDAARAKAPEIMNDKNLQLPNKGGKHNGQRGKQALIQATAEATGLTAEQVRAEVQAGKSLEQVAIDHGKTADDIIAVLRTKGEERLDKALEKAREAITKTPSK